MIRARFVGGPKDGEWMTLDQALPSIVVHVEPPQAVFFGEPAEVAERLSWYTRRYRRSYTEVDREGVVLVYRFEP